MTYARAFGACSCEHLGGRRRTGPQIVDQLGRGVLVLGDLLQDPGGHRLADLRIPIGERLAYAAHRPVVVASYRCRLAALRMRSHCLEDRTEAKLEVRNSR